MNSENPCPLCGRQVALTFHHLIPRKMHRRNFFKRHFSKAELHQGIYVCRLCHSGIHSLFDEMTLAKQYNSLDRLLACEALRRHCRWVAKQHRAE